METIALISMSALIIIAAMAVGMHRVLMEIRTELRVMNFRQKNTPPRKPGE